MKRLLEFREEDLFPQPGRTTIRSVLRSCCLLTVLAALMIPAQARAAFHLWSISEIYSSADRSVQFVEFSTAFSGQQFVGGQTVTAFNSDSSLSVVFTIPSTFSSDSANRSFLIATPGFASVPGGITPDFVFTTAPFLFAGSGSISFSGGDSVSYANLPTDNVASLVRSGATMVFSGVNSPQNYAGAIGAVPEPGVLAIIGFGVLTVGFVLRGRRPRQ